MTTTTTAFVYWDLLKRERILRGRTAVEWRRQCGPRGYIRIRVGHRSKQSPHNGPSGESEWLSGGGGRERNRRASETGDALNRYAQTATSRDATCSNYQRTVRLKFSRLLGREQN